MKYTYVGVDPGNEGYIVAVSQMEIIWSYPIDNSFATLHYAFRELETHTPPHRLLIEEPLTFNAKGKKSNMKGQAERQQAYGVMWGLGMGIGFSGIRRIHPSSWRAYYGFPRNTDKRVHRLEVLARWPELEHDPLSKHEGFVDALLIAEYAEAVWVDKFEQPKGRKKR